MSHSPLTLCMLVSIAVMSACISSSGEGDADCRLAVNACAERFACREARPGAWSCLPTAGADEGVGTGDGARSPVDARTMTDAQPADASAQKGDTPLDSDGQPADATAFVDPDTWRPADDAQVDALRPADAGEPPEGLCPTPALVASDFNVPVQTAVVLDASPSTPGLAELGPLSFAYVIIERPAGSQAQVQERPGAPNDLPRTPTALLVPDAVGDYVLELQVSDREGRMAPSESCPGVQPRVTIHASPPLGIHLELRWHTPGDDGEMDGEGADLDLHLRHPRGVQWNSRPLDCYYANPNPDWGIAGERNDDPVLLLDDIGDGGPEIIALARPEETAPLGAPYRILVDYYREESLTSFEGWGPSDASLLIFLDAELAWENNAAPVRLVHTHDVWEAAEIHWGPEGGRVVPLAPGGLP